MPFPEHGPSLAPLDRWESLRQFAEMTGALVVSKGARRKAGCRSSRQAVGETSGRGGEGRRKPCQWTAFRQRRVRGCPGPGQPGGAGLWPGRPKSREGGTRSGLGDRKGRVPITAHREPASTLLGPFLASCPRRDPGVGRWLTKGTREGAPAPEPHCGPPWGHSH